MGRERGTKSFLFVESTLNKPIDARYIVPKKTDLLDSTNWSTIYEGMPVYVDDDTNENNGLYLYVGGNINDIDSWQKLSSQLVYSTYKYKQYSTTSYSQYIVFALPTVYDSGGHFLRFIFSARWLDPDADTLRVQIRDRMDGTVMDSFDLEYTTRGYFIINRLLEIDYDKSKHIQIRAKLLNGDNRLNFYSLQIHLL